MMVRALAVAAVALTVLVAGGAAADTFAVHLVSQTSSTITLGWSPQPGYGYLFSLDGQLVSRTNDPNRSTVRFSKGTSYDVDVIVKGANGHYPAAPPPPPKAQCEDGVDNDSDGKTDYPADPGCSGATDNDETDPITPPPAGTALWVDTNGGTCTRNPNTGYVDTAACGSFSAAQAAAQPGDLVTVKGGTYGPQTLSANKAGGRIVFEASSGETVNVQAPWGNDSLTLTERAGNLTFRRLNVSWLSGGTCAGESTNVTFENTQIQTMGLHRAVNWLFLGGGVGPAASTNTVDAHPLIDDCGSPITNVNKNVVFDGVYFHDVYTTDPDLHTECLLVTGVDGLTIRNSRFFNCDSTGDIYVTRWNYGSASSHGVVENVLIENTMFLDDCGYSGGPAGSQGCQPWSIQLEQDAQITFRHNTWTKSLLLLSNTNCGSCGDPVRPVIIANNYGSVAGCLTGATFSGNVWHTNPYANSVSCDGTLKSGRVQVVNVQTDLHLTAGSDAIGAANAAYMTATDIDGQTRPIGAAPDAGADEKG